MGEDNAGVAPQPLTGVRIVDLGGELSAYGTKLLAAFGADVVKVEPPHGDWSAESGYRLGPELGVEPGDAVFVANDHMAIGLFSSLRERGLQVPADVSVVGFDDVPEAGYLYPPLTTVRQDVAAKGHLAAGMLADALADRPAVSQLLPATLVVRDSTGPAPA